MSSSNQDILQYMGEISNISYSLNSHTGKNIVHLVLIYVFMFKVDFLHREHIVGYCFKV